jgi:hypothetical protein
MIARPFGSSRLLPRIATPQALPALSRRRSTHIPHSSHKRTSSFAEARHFSVAHADLSAPAELPLLRVPLLNSKVPNRNGVKGR